MTYSKKYTNADFYKDGKFQQDVAMEAMKDMFAFYGVPFTELMAKDMWVTDFGLGDFENVGMGGIFWVNDPEYGGSLGNPNLVDGIWGNSLPFNYKGMKGSMQWAEFCVGIRAHVWKDLYMGWALRFKFRMSSSVAEHGDPWYVPGYGKYNGNTTGVTYTITYKLPF